MTINIWYSSNENAHLSNLAYRRFEYEARIFNSVEQAFQFYKWDFSRSCPRNTEIADLILQATPIQSRTLGRRFIGFNISRWNDHRREIMEDLIYESFMQNPNAKQALLDTGDEILTHRQDQGYWGHMFPEILMNLRSTLCNI